jgi:phosphotransacetylase
VHWQAAFAPLLAGVALCKGLQPVSTAVAHPCGETALAGAIEAAQQGLITPILVGPPTKLEETARKAGVAVASPGVRERSPSR